MCERLFGWLGQLVRVEVVLSARRRGRERGARCQGCGDGTVSGESHVSILCSGNLALVVLGPCRRAGRTGQDSRSVKFIARFDCLSSLRLLCDTRIVFDRRGRVNALVKGETRGSLARSFGWRGGALQSNL